MDLQSLTSSEMFKWAILPALIFCTRVIDVSIGTIRIIYVARGLRLLATICGFFEVLIWLVAITQIMQHLSNFVMYITYAGGFAVGNYIGIYIENRLAMGYVAVRIITQKDATKLVEHLSEKDYGVTSLAAKGVYGKVRLVFSIVRRKDLQEVIQVIKQFNPKAFYSVEDVKMVSNGMPDIPRQYPKLWRKTITKFK